ncbi:saxiphilin-like [Mizuhopecten yessoensis]|uniref:Testican-3 n=1 Tax=Mizuhopecten yessoensis TaxID=6573 RepID=A0A210PVS8_MIZYE|nr:saxiphilin-like [Mizuhopecten yessoensis]OWF40579.1 Testican-3 [Mizuhopecten yessoensis]
MLKLLICFSLAIVVSEAIVCLPNQCATVRCAAVTEDTCNGLVVQNGGFCGCCDACKELLIEGAYCGSGFLLGVPSNSQCGKGLHCDPHTMHCVSDAHVQAVRETAPCAAAHQTYLASQQTNGGFGLLGAVEPLCDENGFYQPKQCEGSVCSCVSKTGRDILNYRADIWQSEDMNCQCARDQQEYMDTGLIGRFFYCTPNGNYQNHQCLGSVCHCIDNRGQMVGTQTVSIGDLAKLSC